MPSHSGEKRKTKSRMTLHLIRTAIDWCQNPLPIGENLKPGIDHLDPKNRTEKYAQLDAYAPDFGPRCFQSDDQVAKNNCVWFNADIFGRGFELMLHDPLNLLKRLVRAAMVSQRRLGAINVAQFLLAVIALMFSSWLGSTPARADRIPGSAYSGKAYYFTTSERPVKVNFSISRKHVGLEELKKIPPIVVGTIESAYIYFADGYTQKTYKNLPDEIWVSQLHLMLTYPDGLPLSQAIPEKARALKAKGEKHGRLIAARQLRSSIYVANVRVVSDEANARNNFIRNPFAVDRGEKRVGTTADGLQHYASGSEGPMVYLDPDEPIIRRINCSQNVERSHPTYYCEYEIILSENLVVIASFVDFRFHGGRAFARKRTRRLREILCEKFPCEDPAKFLARD